MASKSGEALEKLRAFGYAFNKAGQLRKIDKATGVAGNEPYDYEVFDDDSKNEQHYQKLAEQIPEIVYDLLEQNGLQRTYVPENVPPENASFFFSKPAILDKPKKVIVLIHGSGFVRAGQWARSLIINNSLDHGTQIPYIKKAQSLGYDIVVTNTNDNHRIIDGVRKPITGVSSPSGHACYVFQKYIIPANPAGVAIVAHSAGGSVTLELARRFPQFFLDKVFGVAFTDSSHFGMPAEVKKVVTNIACNWVTSKDPVNTEITARNGDIQSRSAGHTKHEWTSYTAMDAVFEFLEEKYVEFQAKNSATNDN